MRLTDLPRPEGVSCVRFRRLPNSKRCQHYSEGGSCALAEGFMCGEWIKRNPRKASGYHVHPDFDPDLATARIAAGEQSASPPVANHMQADQTSEEKSTDERVQDDPLDLDDEKAPTTIAELTEPNATLPGFGRVDVQPIPFRPGSKAPPAAPPAPAPPTEQKQKRKHAAPPVAPPMVPPTEIATEAQVDALSARNVEVILEAEGGFEVALVPRYTEADRLELTYRDAATLANVLSVFPEAKVKAITPCKTTNSKPETPNAPRQ